MHSPEVELTEIFVSNIFNGNGLAPSDKNFSQLNFWRMHQV